MMQDKSNASNPTWTATRIGLLAGLGLLVGIVAWQGMDPLRRAVASVGVRILWLGVFFLLPLFLASSSWWVLYQRNDRPSLARTLLASWIGFAINWLLPVAQIGGDIVKAKIVLPKGRRGMAYATAAVDKTLQLATQAAFASIGLILLVFRVEDRTLFMTLGTGIALLSGLTVVLFSIQQAGLFRLGSILLNRMLRRGATTDRIERSRELDAVVRGLYQSRWKIGLAFLLRLMFRLALAGESYFVLWLMGTPVSLTDALILESAAQTTRTALFLIPGGIGAQEGTFAILGPVLGLTAQTSVAASLCKRGRELMVGLPALLVWHQLSLRDLA